MALQGLQQPMPAGGPRRPEDGGAITMQQAMAQGGYAQPMPGMAQQGMPQQYAQPMQQQAMAQGGFAQPMQQQAMAQAPAAGGTMVCPFCQATTAIGAAGICTFCGSKIV